MKLFGECCDYGAIFARLTKWLASTLSEHVWKHSGSRPVPTAGQQKGRECSKSRSGGRGKVWEWFRVMVKRRKKGKTSSKCICDSISHCFSGQVQTFLTFISCKHFFRKVPTYFCNSSNCKSPPGQLQAGSIFISAGEDELAGRNTLFSLSITYLARICLHFTAHLLCVCCSCGYYCTAHYLPVDRGGQQLCQTAATADSWVQRAAGLLQMEGAGEPSSLADAPVLCGAGTGEEGREKKLIVDGVASKSLNILKCSAVTQSTISCCDKTSGRRRSWPNITWIFTMSNKAA